MVLISSTTRTATRTATSGGQAGGQALLQSRCATKAIHAYMFDGVGGSEVYIDIYIVGLLQYQAIKPSSHLAI